MLAEHDIGIYFGVRSFGYKKDTRLDQLNAIKCETCINAVR